MSKIERWEVEDKQFWESTGKAVATRNLWVSIPCLLCAFAVWLYWSIIIVQMKNLGYSFDAEQLYTLPAIAGLVGATLRIPNSFMIGLSGGRNVIAVTTALLILPALGAGIALQDSGTSFAVFAVLAALSGIGGGVFASSMSNISFFFPKSVQGTSLGLNAGLGNLGVSVMQVTLPFVMTFGLFGALGGGSMNLNGKEVWIQNCGLVWVPILAVLAILAWLFMNNLPMHKTGTPPVAIGKILWLELLGLIAGGIGVYLMIFANLPINIYLKLFAVLTLVVFITLAFMQYLTPPTIKENLMKQFAIFKLKHNWVMTWLYIMTFGSFIGYSAAFPKLIQDVFGSLPNGDINPLAPNPFAYAWLGPLVGSLIRPVGGWLSDKLGGARVTHWDTIVMIISAVGVGYVITLAGKAEQPADYWWPFLILFLLLFITTGIGNGSTFRMIGVIFKPEHAGPVLGWTSAIAAYGAFIIPKVFGIQIGLGKAEYALYGFAVYYLSCLFVNWWFYVRRGAEIEC